MSGRRLRQAEAELLRGAEGSFSDSEIAGLPGPVQAYFRASIAVGTPLARTARVRMRGRIKIGRWLPFRAREVLTPQVGFLWAARAAGVISGSDRFAGGQGRMDWRLAGLLPVMRAGGPDVSRSAAERGGAEGVWVPTAMLPRFDVTWTASGEDRITACYEVSGHPMRVDCWLTPAGLIRSVTFDRWGDPSGNGEYALHVFGGEFTAHAAFGGVTIPSEGRLGWYHGTPRWGEGEFFRYRITGLELVGAGP